MTTEQRDALFNALLDKMPPVPLVTEMLTEDIDAIAPVIDGWLLDAFERGRFQGILETMVGALCKPASAHVKCYACEEPASFITYKKAHCFEHRPEMAKQ